MATVVEKVRTVVLSNLHELLDKTIDLNSTGAIKQHIRDLEMARDKITDEAAIAKGRLLTLQSEVRDLTVQVGTTNENIDLFINDGDPANDNLAETLEARLIGFEKKLAEKKEALVAETTTSTALEDASNRLRAKHAAMVETLRKLESIERTTKAKEAAAAALRQASKTGEVSVDNVTQRLKERETVANARFERALGDMADKVDTDVVAEQARKRIAARRVKAGAAV